MSFKLWNDARQYGVVADGAADDTAALQAAIDASYGGMLLLPAGEIRITSGITIKQPIKMVGMGNPEAVDGITHAALAGGTQITHDATSGVALTISPNAPATESLTGVLLQDFFLLGNNDKVGATTGTGIKIEGGVAVNDKLDFVNVSVRRCLDDAWHIADHGFSYTFTSCVGSHSGRYGFFFESAGDLGILSLNSVWAIGNDTAGFYFSQSGPISINGLTAEDSATGVICDGGTLIGQMLNLERCQTALDVQNTGNDLRGININSPLLTSAIGVRVRSGAGRSRFHVLYGSLGTTPIPIQMDGGSERCMWETNPLPTNLPGTVTVSGASEVFLQHAFERVTKAGVAIFNGTPWTDAIDEKTTGAGVTVDGVLLKDGLVDGRDIVTDGSKLDGIEAAADVTDAANVAAAGAYMADGTVALNGPLDHDGSTVGFYGVTPVARPAAYTQTYATATRTHAARTAAALTNSQADTTTDGTLEAIGSTTSTLTDRAPQIERNFSELNEQINNLRADQQNTAQLLNQLLDDLQSLGLNQ